MREDSSMETSMKTKELIRQITPPIIYSTTAHIYRKHSLKKHSFEPAPADVPANQLPQELFDDVRKSMDKGLFDFSENTLRK